MWNWRAQACAFFAVVLVAVMTTMPGTASAQVTSGSSTLVVHAVGHSGSENVDIRIDGVLVDSFNPERWSSGGSFFSLPADPGWATYTYVHPTQIDPADVRLEFKNDAHSIALMRDVRVDKIVIDGIVYETEHPSVISEGNWTTSRCSGGPVAAEADSLYCNGYFQYAATEDTPPPPSTGTFYVSPDGDNTATGSATEPWRDVAFATGDSSPVDAGDTIVVLPGTYVETITLEKSGNDVDGHITLVAQGSVVLQDPDPLVGGFREGVIQSADQGFWIIDGFRIENSSWAGIALRDANDMIVRNNHTFETGASGIIVMPEDYYLGGEEEITSSNIQIIDNVVERANWRFEPGPKNAGSPQEALSLWGVDGFDIAGNLLTEGNKEGIDVKVGSRNGAIRDNVVTGMALVSGNYGSYRGGPAIYLDGNRAHSFNIDIYNNVVYDNFADGIVIADEVPANGGVEDVRVWNNVVYNNGNLGINGGVGIGLFDPLENIDIVHNTVAFNIQALRGNSRNGESTGLRVEANVFANNVFRTAAFDGQFEIDITQNLFAEPDGLTVHGDWDPGDLTIENVVSADADFVDAPAADFRLGSDSPALDAGSAQAPSFATSDADGVDRPRGPATDIGAFEAAPATPNTAPTAEAGVDQTVIDTDGDGQEAVTLDGSGSFDADGDRLTFEWLEGLQVIAVGESPTIDLPVGGHALLLRVSDSSGAVAEDGVLINVDPAPDEPDGSTLTIHAVGHAGSEIINIRIDGVLVDSFNPVRFSNGGSFFSLVEDPGWASYTYVHPTTINPGEVRLEFVNDANSLALMRDVRVDKIVIDGASFETEDASVISEGNWTVSRCSGGPATAEVDSLYCNGYFQFAEADVVDPPVVDPPAGFETPELVVETVVSGISTPWGSDFLPSGEMLYAERIGRLHIWDPSTETSTEISLDMSDIVHGTTGGLLGIAIDPGFDENRRFYSCQTGASQDGATEWKVIAWTLNEQATSAARVGDPLVRAANNLNHVGCELGIDAAGHLFVTTGDDFVGSYPQDTQNLNGKVLRIDRFSGEGVAGNPFFGSESSTAAAIYTYGHRNVQGLAFRPNGQIWSIEHGSAVDDEINLLVAGGNYGWDPVPLGDDVPDPRYPLYDEVNNPMTDLQKFPDALTAKWSSGDPTVAPGGGDFVVGEAWGSLDGALAVGVLKDRYVAFYRFDDDGEYLDHVIVAELDGTYGRIRTATMGPDGSLYIGTSNSGFGSSDTRQDVILKVTPKSALPPDPDPTGESTLVVHAVGHDGSEVINIRIDGVVVDSFSPVKFSSGASFFSLVPNPGWATYTYVHPTQIDAGDVRLEFRNDANSATLKRDVRVDKIVIDGVTFETEHPAVVSEGNWTVSQCSGGPANAEADSLYCNGYFQYAPLG